MTTPRRALPDDPYAALRAVLRDQMSPADRRAFDEFLASLAANAATTSPKEPKS